MWTEPSTSSSGSRALDYSIERETAEEEEMSQEACLRQVHEQRGAERNGTQCPATLDEILLDWCWPTTASGEEVVVPCNDQATLLFRRECSVNGTWRDARGYEDCFGDELLELRGAKLSYVLYWTGYALSLAACLFALALFAHYRTALNTVRTKIHASILLAFALHNVVWCLSAVFHVEIRLEEPMWLRCSAWAALHYCASAAFHWMFVEGMHLFLRTACSLRASKFERFLPFALFAWLSPLLLTVLSVTVGPSDSCASAGHSPFLVVSSALLVSLNTMLLLAVMRILVRKVNAGNERERYLKSARALLLLCPLVGANYAVGLVAPSRPVWLASILAAYTTVCSSLQGLLVAVFFCFTNKEVQDCVRRSFERIKTSLRLQRETSNRIRKRAHRVRTSSTWTTATGNGDVNEDEEGRRESGVSKSTILLSEISEEGEGRAIDRGFGSSATFPMLTLDEMPTRNEGDCDDGPSTR